MRSKYEAHCPVPYSRGGYSNPTAERAITRASRSEQRRRNTGLLRHNEIPQSIKNKPEIPGISSKTHPFVRKRSEQRPTTEELSKKIQSMTAFDEVAELTRQMSDLEQRKNKGFLSSEDYDRLRQPLTDRHSQIVNLHRKTNN